MKIFTVMGALLLSASAAQAQALPVPGGHNPDWVLEKTVGPATERNAAHPDALSEANSAAAKGVIHPKELSQDKESMPNVSPGSLGPTTPMPTAGMPATGSGEIMQMRNNSYSYSDNKRQLFYYWRSKPGSQAPDSIVKVFSDKTKSMYTFRRAKPKSPAAPRPAPHK